MKKELPAGRIEGPFMQLPFHTFYVLLEAWSQKAPGESRILQYLSFPEGNSVNDNIDASYTSVTHASREDAIRLVRVIYGQDGHQKSFPHHPSLSKFIFSVSSGTGSSILTHVCLWAFHLHSKS